MPFGYRPLIEFYTGLFVKGVGVKAWLRHDFIKIINSVGLRLPLTTTFQTEFIRELEVFPGEELAPKRPGRKPIDGK